jgi:diguanylate cyclase (GGDEF)-like protein
MSIGSARAGARRVVWSRAVAWVVLAAGLAFSAGAAAYRYRGVEAHDTESFRATSGNVQTIVATQLARQDDMLDTFAGMMTALPDMSNAAFAQWYSTARIVERFPGGLGVSYIEVVPADRLAAFTAQQVADPITGLPPTEGFTVYPDRPAAVYCLTRLAVWEVAEVNGFVIPAGLDYCAPEIVPGTPSSLPAVLDQATVEAAPALVPMDDLTPGVLAEFLPVYGSADVPATAEQRRQQVAASFDADALAASAVAGQSDLSVAVDRSTPDGVEHIASAGNAGRSRTVSTTLPVSDDGAWTVIVTQATTPAGITATAQAAFVLIGGVLTSLLLFALLRVLGTSRERALAMVSEKTEQLEYQALHDTLTGLPNRALLMDRATQMLARQERSGAAVAALFVDLDDFKSVNDSFGHAAGDAFLRAVAVRIESLFRGSDTVGRLGGDEFVVLLEDDPAADGAELAAQRILGLLADPIDLDGITVPVSCSIGVAMGPRASADDLLRDADVAMYQAKVGGKGRCVVFGAPADEALAPMTEARPEGVDHTPGGVR